MKKILNSCLGWLRCIGRMLLGFRSNVVALLGPSPGWPGMKRWLLQIATLGILAGLCGFLVSLLGLVPIKASSGHWPITSWFLNFTMTRSVSTHTLGMKVPALDNPGMVLKGATHYETGCFPCHGNPTLQHPRIASHMTPHPPYLPPIVDQWEPQELFYIVKHGVKFTGMPAWPTQQRDDEVWAMVAFLQKFPELSEQEYRHMVDGESTMSESRLPSSSSGEDAPIQELAGRKLLSRSVSDSCGRCHGVDGQGRQAGVAPKLAGQSPAYLEAALEAFTRDERHSGIMAPIAASLSHEETREIALFYSKLSPSQAMPNSSESELAIRRGAMIAQGGLPNARIPICAECHGPGDNPRNPAYPILAGQCAEYLVLQLELFAVDRRGGSEFAPLMHPVANRLTPEQRRDVALYYESLAEPVVSPAR